MKIHSRTRKAQIALDHSDHYCVMTEDVHGLLNSQIINLLQENYGEDVLAWSVKEDSGINYVYAYPSTITSEADRLRLRNVIRSLENIFSRQNCLDLSDGINNSGAYFRTCGNENTSTSYSRLDLYGWDNRFESYYESLPSGAVKLYDNWYWINELGIVIGDTGTFGSWNNRTSSMITYY